MREAAHERDPLIAVGWWVASMTRQDLLHPSYPIVNAPTFPVATFPTLSCTAGALGVRRATHGANKAALTYAAFGGKVTGVERERNSNAAQR